MQVVAVHPTQLYETAVMFLVFMWLWRRREHGHGVGWLWGCYLVFAGAERFLVEFVRAKDDRLVDPFTLAQVTSILLIVVGGLLMYWWRTPAGAGAVPQSLRLNEPAARA